MIRFLVKTLLSALVIAAVSEIGRRSTWLAAILAALPLTSILAMIWLYADTQNAEQVSRLSLGIFWAVLPSLLLFVVLPVLLRQGIRFPVALPLACFTTVVGYGIYFGLLRYWGMEL